MADYTRIDDIVAGVENATQTRNNSKNDEGTDTLEGVDWFSYNGTVCSSIYVSGNIWIGLGASSEHLKVNRQDAAMYNIWREEGNLVTLLRTIRFLRIRWSGYTTYSSTDSRFLMTFDVLMFETGDIMLYVADIPTSFYNGKFSLGNMSYDKPTVENRYVTFYLQSDGSYVAEYAPIEYAPIDLTIKKYLVRDGNTLYTVTDGSLVEVSGELNSNLFIDNGVDEIPDGTLLMTLSDPEVLFWGNEDIEPTLTATVTGIPYPQIIISDKIHLTDNSITGIESVLATCEGDLIVAVSFDDKQTWKAWNGEQWATLSDDNTGMSKETLEGITFEQWNELYTGATGFYVRVSLLDTTQTVEKIVFDFSN